MIATTQAGCMGWVPGRQSYWDAKVKELCKKDGGVTIYEKVRISRSDLKRGVLLVNGSGEIEVSQKAFARPDAPVYAERKITYLREGNPVVGRTEWNFIRRADDKIVAKSISYGRGGGDFPSPAERSSFRCPDRQKELADLQQLFIVDGVAN